MNDTDIEDDYFNHNNVPDDDYGREHFPEYFIWTCCDAQGDDSPCETGWHQCEIEWHQEQDNYKRAKF